MRALELPRLQQERDLGTIISDAFTLLFADCPSLAKMVAPAVLVGTAGQLVLYGLREEELAADLVSLLLFPVVFAAYSLASAAVISSLDARDRGREIDSGAALDVAQDRFGDVVGATLRAIGIVFLLALTVIGIPWAIKRMINWAFTIQSIIIAGQQGEPSLAYSEAMVKGRWWVTFGRLLGSALVVGLPAVIVNLLILAAIPGVIGVIFAQTTSFLAMPYGIIATTLIFCDLKLRKGPPT